MTLRSFTILLKQKYKTFSKKHFNTFVWKIEIRKLKNCSPNNKLKVFVCKNKLTETWHSINFSIFFLLKEIKCLGFELQYNFQIQIYKEMKLYKLTKLSCYMFYHLVLPIDLINICHSSVAEGLCWVKTISHQHPTR